MATINCTNTAAITAFKGETVDILLSGPESLSVLPVLAIGQLATVSSSGATGYVSFVDTYGHKFRVKPVRPNTQFNSSGLNTMSVSELITITY